MRNSACVSSSCCPCTEASMGVRVDEKAVRQPRCASGPPRGTRGAAPPSPARPAPSGRRASPRSRRRPAPGPSTRSASSARAVSMMTGMEARARSARMPRQMAKPSVSGSMTSRTTRSGFSERSEERNPLPSAYSRTRKRSFFNPAETRARISSSSSTIVMSSFIHRECNPHRARCKNTARNRPPGATNSRNPNTASRVSLHEGNTPEAKLTFAVILVLLLAAGAAPGFGQSALTQLRAKVNHIVVIYQENWSFDALYGHFPGANGICECLPGSLAQVDKSGAPLGCSAGAAERQGRRSALLRPCRWPMPLKPYDLPQRTSAPDVADRGHRPPLLHAAAPDRRRKDGQVRGVERQRRAGHELLRRDESSRGTARRRSTRSATTSSTPRSAARS